MMRVLFIITLVLPAVVLASCGPGTPARAEEAKPGQCELYGKIQIVESFPDVKVKIVKSFPDIKVKLVESFADDPGEWQMVDSFPDFKVQIVESFPDYEIQYVESFPSCK